MERQNDSSVHNEGARTAGVDSPVEVPAGMTVLDSRSLFGDSREIGIRHEGSLYRLKITRQRKLILNK